MIEGIVLGILAWFSLVLSWTKLPTFIKKLSLRFQLLSDVGASILIYLFLSSVSKSLVAVIGAIVAGLLTNLTILYAGKTNVKV